MTDERKGYLNELLDHIEEERHDLECIIENLKLGNVEYYEDLQGMIYRMKNYSDEAITIVRTEYILGEESANEN